MLSAGELILIRANDVEKRRAAVDVERPLDVPALLALHNQAVHVRRGQELVVRDLEPAPRAVLARVRGHAAVVHRLGDVDCGQLLGDHERLVQRPPTHVVQLVLIVVQFVLVHVPPSYAGVSALAFRRWAR